MKEAVLFPRIRDCLASCGRDSTLRIRALGRRARSKAKKEVEASGVEGLRGAGVEDPRKGPQKTAVTWGRDGVVFKVLRVSEVERKESTGGEAERSLQSKLGKTAGKAGIGMTCSIQGDRNTYIADDAHKYVKEIRVAGADAEGTQGQVVK